MTGIQDFPTSFMRSGFHSQKMSSFLLRAAKSQFTQTPSPAEASMPAHNLTEIVSQVLCFASKAHLSPCPVLLQAHMEELKPQHHLSRACSKGRSLRPVLPCLSNTERSQGDG